MKLTKRQLNKVVYLVIVVAIAWFFNEADNDRQKTAYSMDASVESEPVRTELMLVDEQGDNRLNVVSRVVDGDTLEIVINGEKQKIRLIGVNTPETVDPRRSVQCFGKEASAFAEKMLSGQSVRLEVDDSQSNVDKYGRLLRYVYLDDGRLFNQELIAAGYGTEYTYKTPYKYQAEFKAAEAKAKQEKLGLWADGACNIK